MLLPIHSPSAITTTTNTKIVPTRWSTMSRTRASWLALSKERAPRSLQLSLAGVSRPGQFVINIGYGGWEVTLQWQQLIGKAGVLGGRRCIEGDGS